MYLLIKVKWIKKSWGVFPTDSFEKCFLKFCINNAVDSLKDFFSDSDESSLTNMKSETEDMHNVNRKDIWNSQLTDFKKCSDSEW